MLFYDVFEPTINYFQGIYFTATLFVLLGSIQKTESLGSFTSMHLVMHVMSFHNSLHVGMFGDKLYFDSAMNNYIVKNKIKFIAKHPYMKRIMKAHYVHHKVHTREGAEAFGFLYAPKKYE